LDTQTSSDMRRMQIQL